MEKKIYEKPVLQVVNIEEQCAILAASGEVNTITISDNENEEIKDNESIQSAGYTNIWDDTDED